MFKGLLTYRNYNVPENNWYAPQKFLKSFPSVVEAEYINTTSSAGDWDGYLIQKIGNRYHVIFFFQENNYPGGGFTLTTGFSSIPESSLENARKAVEVKLSIINDYAKVC